MLKCQKDQRQQLHWRHVCPHGGTFPADSRQHGHLRARGAGADHVLTCTPARRSAGKQTYRHQCHHHPWEREELVHTFGINTCPKGHGGNNQHGPWGKEYKWWQGEFGEHAGRSVPKTKAAVVPFTGQHCCKSLGHRLSVSGVSKSLKCQNPQTFRPAPCRPTGEKGKKLLQLCVVAKDCRKRRNVQIRTLSKPAAGSPNVAMPNAKSFITEKFPAASLENELFPVTKAKLSHAKGKKKKAK